MFSSKAITALAAAFALVNNVAGQRGLAYIPKNPADDSIWVAPGSPISWYYNWGSVNVASYNGKLEYVPMMWGKDQALTFPSQVKSLKSNGVNVQHVLAFNEPDAGTGGGSGVSASDAASLYKQYYQPLASLGLSLGGPSTTGSPSGLQWYAEFMSACSGCQIDFIPIHWYGNLDGLKWYIGAVQKAYPDKKIWVTEFADSSASSTSDATAFTTAAMEMFDSNPMIERYSIFPAVRQSDSSIPYSGLLDNSGNLSPVGSLYMKGAAVKSGVSSAGASSTSGAMASGTKASVAMPSGSATSSAAFVPSGGMASSSPVAISFAGSEPSATAAAAAPSGSQATVVVADARGPVTVTVTIDSCKASSSVVVADVAQGGTSTNSPAEGTNTPERHRQSGHYECNAPHPSATPDTARLAKKHIVAARRGKHHHF